MACKTGFTKSIPATDDIKPYTCESIQFGSFPHGDAKFHKQGRWRFTQNTAVCTTHPCDNAHLKCEAVICPLFPRPLYTKGSKDDGDNNYQEIKLKDLEDETKTKRCLQSNNFNPREPNDFTRYMDSCKMECVDGWYGKSATGDPAEDRSVVYTCSEPADRSGVGVWCPGPECSGFTDQKPAVTQELVCEKGELSPTRSLLLGLDPSFKGAASGTRREAVALPWPIAGAASNSITDPGGPGLGGGTDGKRPASVSPFLGWRFGTATGPIYNFLIQAKDTQNLPRNYLNLQKRTHADYVVVKIGA